jgi:hypothetical protein
MSALSSIEGFIKIFLGKSLTIDGATVSVASLLKSLGAIEKINWTDVASAVEQGNWEADIVPIEDILRIVGLFVPPVAIAEADFEAIMPILQFIFTSVQSEPLVNVNGTWVTRSWIDDPRHQLNPDGSFRR